MLLPEFVDLMHLCKYKEIMLVNKWWIGFMSDIKRKKKRSHKTVPERGNKLCQTDFL